MSTNSTNHAKVEKPSAHFAEPHEVVVDPQLSQPQKAQALEVLEQDARQLAEAASEGMAGGERNKLHDVLIAKEILTLPPMPAAYETVLQDLRTRLKRDPANGTRKLIAQAIAALERLAADLSTTSAAS